jgi:hypothetical protein
VPLIAVGGTHVQVPPGIDGTTSLGFISKVLATVGASCKATTCTITVPAETARTVDIKVFAVSLWSSPLTAKDRYRYVKA